MLPTFSLKVLYSTIILCLNCLSNSFTYCQSSSLVIKLALSKQPNNFKYIVVLVFSSRSNIDLSIVLPCVVIVSSILLLLQYSAKSFICE